MRSGLVLTAALVALAACQRDQDKAPVAPAPDAAPTTVGAATVLSGRPEQRTFRDWRAACDNGALCFAFAPSVQPDAGWLRLSLAPDARAAPVVMVGLWSPGAEGLNPAADLTLAIDGRAFVAARVEDADQPIARFAGPDVVPVVRALAAGKRAVLSAGGQEIELSLAGAAAAMLWIDERQGRLATPNALIRVGERPTATTPPALPRITAAPAVDQTGLGSENPTLPAAIEALPAVKRCRHETSWNEYVRREVFSARLEDRKELWAVPCFAGAYNLGVQVFVTGAGGRDPLPVAFPTALGTPTDTVVNAEYDPATRTLSAFNKGRGIGDCGVAQRWTWTGAAFVLKDQSEMHECMGVPADLWPTLWRTR